MWSTTQVASIICRVLSELRSSVLYLEEKPMVTQAGDEDYSVLPEAVDGRPCRVQCHPYCRSPLITLDDSKDVNEIVEWSFRI